MKVNKVVSLASDVDKIKHELAKHHDEMIAFLREIVRIPSYDSKIGPVGDAMGNILGRVGYGSRVMVYDSHIDTVGIADRSQWQFDPFEGKVEDGIIY